MAAPNVDRVVVVFDDGPTIEIQPKSRDILALEREGLDIEACPPMEMGYRSAFIALRRMGRNGQLPDGFTPPATVEVLMDIADIDFPEPDQGEGSGQAASTG